MLTNLLVLISHGCFPALQFAMTWSQLQAITRLGEKKENNNKGKRRKHD